MNKTRILLIFSLVLLLISCNKEKRDNDGQDSKSKIDHLLIEEVFYTGSFSKRDYGGKIYTVKYDEDCYFKIVNPSDKVLYLDGLYLAYGQFSGDANYKMTLDDFRESHYGVYSMMKFPGDGKTYPVEPGKSVTITGFAYDHRIDNGWEYTVGNTPNSIDLSGADFEWLTSKQIKSKYDIEDTNDVPNLIPGYWGFYNGKWYPSEEYSIPEDNRNYRFEIFKINTSLALVKLEKPIEELSTDEYKWNFSMEVINEHTHDFLGKGICLKLPPEWIVDVVTICPLERYKERPIPEALDAGWASVMTAGSDEWSQRTKSIKRKFDGNTWVDTNNSTLDFEIVTPSYFQNKEEKPEEGSETTKPE